MASVIAAGTVPAPFSERVPGYTQRVEAALRFWLPPVDREPLRLHEAMRYSLLGGGKHIRPILMYAAGEVLDVAPEALDGPATAVEMIHAYSLVHDDLPAMDDDDLRRGQPTCHKVFGDAVAILAGDALQALAFQVLASDPAVCVSPDRRVAMIQLLAEACGSLGMAGGQAIDLAATGKQLSAAGVESMHNLKTGALIRASVLMAYHGSTSQSDSAAAALDAYGRHIGLAFQIQDDILDEEGETATLGKTKGKDRDANKPTYPAIVGMHNAKQRARALADEAVKSLSVFGKRAEPLHWLADYIVQRAH
jgi:farnesyl diphosphate synthase